MKKYTITNNETGRVSSYSEIEWTAAWWIVFLVGFISGAIIF